MGRFADILRKTAEKTNAQLASEISSLTVLTDSQIVGLFPAKADKERLLELLEIVNAATTENQKIAQLKKNIESLAGTVVKLVGALV